MQIRIVEIINSQENGFNSGMCLYKKKKLKKEKEKKKRPPNKQNTKK